MFAYFSDIDDYFNNVERKDRKFLNHHSNFPTKITMCATNKIRCVNLSGRKGLNTCVKKLKTNRIKLKLKNRAINEFIPHTPKKSKKIKIFTSEIKIRKQKRACDPYSSSFVKKTKSQQKSQNDSRSSSSIKHPIFQAIQLYNQYHSQISQSHTPPSYEQYTPSSLDFLKAFTTPTQTISKPITQRSLSKPSARTLKTAKIPNRPIKTPQKGSSEPFCGAKDYIRIIQEGSSACLKPRLGRIIRRSDHIS
ncbi:unnamed protein product [Moneuplotes crassus]|uniref:Uncharacterized protein n=1 Tax=Euplotes crassus TaxID=5936 RepID=A0AAD1U8L5_EUPCR|nr:unnamed protein product [Moneuplotes crassus]